MKILELKEQYFGRRFIIKTGPFSPPSDNVVYIGKLKTDRFNNCEVLRCYIFDQLPEKTVVAYIPEFSET